MKINKIEEGPRTPEWRKHKPGISYAEPANNEYFIFTLPGKDSTKVIHKIDFYLQFPRFYAGQWGSWMCDTMVFSKCGVELKSSGGTYLDAGDGAIMKNVSFCPDCMDQEEIRKLLGD